MKTNYIKVGSIIKPQGTRGQLRVAIDDIFEDDFIKAGHIFILERGTYVPYFMESLKESNHLLLKLEDIDNPENASSFSMKEIYLNEKNVHSDDYLDQKDKQELIDYMVIDGNQKIGTISDLQLFPHQIMASVNYRGKSIYIPLVDEFILSIDHEAKKIMMTLPEGFLDL